MSERSGLFTNFTAIEIVKIDKGAVFAWPCWAAAAAWLRIIRLLLMTRLSRLGASDALLSARYIEEWAIITVPFPCCYRKKKEKLNKIVEMWSYKLCWIPDDELLFETECLSGEWWLLLLLIFWLEFDFDRLFLWLCEILLVKLVVLEASSTGPVSSLILLSTKPEDETSKTARLELQL